MFMTFGCTYLSISDCVYVCSEEWNCETFPTIGINFVVVIICDAFDLDLN